MTPKKCFQNFLLAKAQPHLHRHINPVVCSFSASNPELYSIPPLFQKKDKIK